METIDNEGKAGMGLPHSKTSAMKWA